MNVKKMKSKRMADVVVYLTVIEQLIRITKAILEMLG